MKKPFYLKLNDNKVSIKYNTELNKKVYKIIDKLNDVTIYYDFYKLNLLGYKGQNKNLVNLMSLSKYIKYIPSIKEVILKLGFKKHFYKFLLVLHNDLLHESILVNFLLFHIKLKVCY